MFSIFTFHVKIKSISFSFIILLFAAFPFAGIAQQNKIDSLEKVLRKSKNKIDEIQILRKLSWEYKYTDPDKALEYGRQAFALAVELNDKLSIAGSLNSLGMVYKVQGNYDKALEYYRQSLIRYKELNEQPSVSSIYNNLGIIYNITGKKRESIDNFLASIKIAETLNDPKELIYPLNNLGAVYAEIGNNEKAAQVYLRALKLARLVNDTTSIVYTLSNVGFVYEMQEKYDTAFSYYQRSLTINKIKQDYYSLSFDYTNIALAYRKLKDFDNALDYIDSAFAVAEEIDLKNEMAAASALKGSIYRTAGNPGKAIEYFKKAYDLRKMLGLKNEMANMLDSIGNVYFYTSKNPVKGLEFFLKELELCTEISDTLCSANSHFNLGKVFLSEKKYANAETHLKAAEKAYMSSHAKDSLSKVYRTISIMYDETGNKTEGTKYSRLYSQLRDSLDMQDVAKMKLRFENDKKNTQIGVLEKDAEINKLKLEQNELKLQQKQLQLYGSLIIAILLLLLSLWIFNFYRQKKKANEKLEAANTEISKQKTEIEHKNKDIMDSINYAQRLQLAILPSDDDFKKTLPDAFVFYQPKDIVSGDFYFLDQVGEHIFFAVVDCTGHGVPGAFVSFVGHKALSRAINDLKLTEPGKILDSIRQQVEQTFDKNEKGEVKDGMDISLGVLNAENNTLHFSGAHHTLYWINGEGELTEVKGDRHAVGAGQGKENFTTAKVNVKKGDMIYFSSDGYSDQFGGEHGKKFKTSQFKKLLLELNDKPVALQKELLQKAHNDWKSAHEQVDDVCVIGVRIV